MQKMKTVFVIDRATHRATQEVQLDWVMRGEGRATIKFDGTSVAVIGGKLFKRYDAKNGKSPPEGAIPCEEHPDPKTGHWPHWVPVIEGDPSSRHHLEAFDGQPDGTYELVGPKVQGNRYGLDHHEMWRHGSVEVDIERTPEAMVEWLHQNQHEGIVFHHPDGRMGKLRRKDFGIKW